MRSPDTTLLPNKIKKENKPYLSTMDRLMPEGEIITNALGVDNTRDSLLATYCLTSWVLKQKGEKHNKPGFLDSIFHRNKAQINEKLIADLEERTAAFIETGYTDAEKEAHLPQNIKLAVHDYTAQCKYYDTPAPAMTQPTEDFTRMWKKRWSEKIQKAA